MLMLMRMAVVVPIEAAGGKSRPASLGVEIHPRNEENLKK